MKRLLLIAVLVLTGCGRGHGITTVPIEGTQIVEVSTTAPECVSVRGYDRRIGAERPYDWIATYCKEE